MTSPFKFMNGSFRCLIETTNGTLNAPAASDAVLTRAPFEFAANLEMLDQNYYQESLSDFAPIPGMASPLFRVPCWMRGATAPGTTPPDWTQLLRACGYSQTLTSAAVTGTSQAISSSSITLAAGASSTDNIYRGMPIDGTSGTVNGQRRWITAYNGTTKVATVSPAWSGATGTPTYSIPKNALYAPLTQGHKTLSCYGYEHDSTSGNTSRLYAMTGAAGNFAISAETGKLPSIDFDLTGIYTGAPTDVSAPSVAAPSGLTPVPILSASVYIADTAVVMASMRLQSGNTVMRFPDPSVAYGYQHAEITRRRVAGSIVANAVHTSTRDVFADMGAGTTRIMTFAWGATAGKKISIVMPAVQIVGVSQQVIDGTLGDALDFRAAGLDAECFICVAE